MTRNAPPPNSANTHLASRDVQGRALGACGLRTVARKDPIRSESAGIGLPPLSLPYGRSLLYNLLAVAMAAGWLSS